PFKKTRRLRPLMGVLVVLIVSAILVGAVAFTFYAQVSSTHTVGRLWEIKDDSSGSMGSYREMGDDAISFDTDLTAGENALFNFTIKLSGNSAAEKPLYFLLTADDVLVNITTDGFDVNNDNLEDSFTFSPSDEVTFCFNVTVDDYCPSGEHTTELLLTKN
ncbi:unnamed protein product, partial [marine sediment metagenome]